jgi:pyruvate dehydrogenase E1 component alpha subunit
MATAKNAKSPAGSRIADLGLGKPELEQMLRRMYEIRAFEEKVAYFFSRGMIHGTTHLYVGEEATAVGIISALREEDWISSTHRGHGHTIAKGIDLNRMMAELFGRETGYCKGKGGSMHIADLTRGNLGANGIVGGGIPIATGAGITSKLKGLDRVSVAFFGDGAINEGSFHESVNLASVWDLPVLYVCEDNQYGMSMSRHKSINLKDLAQRAKAYGIPGKTIDGNDILEVYAETKKALEHVRKKGPYLLVSETYRYLGHSKSDANRYRTKEEINEWKKKDPIPRLRSEMTASGLFSEADLDAIEKVARDELEEAVEFAQNSPEPSLDSLTDDVYA